MRNTPSVDAVLVGLHLRWDGVYQRPQHLISRIARRLPVLVIEEPLIDGTVGDEVLRDGDVTIVRPHRAAAGEAIDERAVEYARHWATERRPLVWLYTPMMLALPDAFAGAPLIFDAMDELAKFAHADPRLGANETALLARADVVFCGGPSLYRSRAGRAKRVFLYASGVDVEFFERARTLPAHADLAALPQPVFGYVGVIDERVDLDLVAAIAEARPGATVAMIGPVAKIDPAGLPQRRNIAYLGKRAYADLPSLLAGMTVGLMPFAMNESTKNISPTKTLEYLAAGLPVVSTPVPDVVEGYGDIAYVARDAADFIAALARAEAGDPDRAARGDRRTHAATWDAITASMLRDIERAGIAVNATLSRL
ncbi:MAG: glycosyltransferase [Candidatus Velthaea sp.]